MSQSNGLQPTGTSATPLTLPLSPSALADYCAELLSCSAYKDYCPNGLQVDAGQAISHVVTGVTACEALIDEAIARNAQALVVHHGYFWKGEPAPLVGMKGARIRKLMQHGISLIAYHLPLDGHATLGNNAALIDQLNLTREMSLFPDNPSAVGDIALASHKLTPEAFYQQLETAFNRKPLHIASGRKHIQRIGICSGGAQDFIDQAAAMNCDAYISGEISERTTHSARELGIDYFACGHHATEQGGVQRLGAHLAQTLGLEVSFVDIANPA